MQSTRVMQGIRGIFPLIKQHAPAAVEKLSSLSELPPGYRLAIDATLLVQKLHFADDAGANRHLIGIYRLVRTLQAAQVRPIMVFDNPSARLPQKQREQAKRKQARSLTSARSLVEKLRRDRLGNLQQALAQWKSLQDAERAEVAELLKQWSSSKQPLAIAGAATLMECFGDKTTVERAETMQGTATWPYKDFDLTTIDDEEALILQDTTGEPSMDDQSDLDLQLSQALHAVEELRNENEEGLWFANDVVTHTQEQLLTAPADIDAEKVKTHEAQSSMGKGIWSDIKESEASMTVSIASRIASARRQYLDLQAAAMASVASHEQKKEAIVADEAVPPPPLPSFPPETATQARLTAMEASLYASLESPRCKADDVTSTSAEAMALSETTTTMTTASTEMEPHEEIADEEPLALKEIAAQNEVLERSYTRKAEPLTARIFNECADLCRLLNIPVFWTGDGSRTGGRAHEAEAMAAMLVRYGHADAVASEDSDVLMYDVKLLRGLIGARGIEIVDAKQVRLTFFPLRPVEKEKESEADRIEADKESGRKMLDFALLCGTDFNRTVAGIGPVRALKLIQIFGSINGIRQEVIRIGAQSRRDERAEKLLPAPEVNKALEETRKKSSKTQQQSRGDKAMASMMSKFALPNGLTWREYSKELTQARDVYRRPPSLYREMRKLKGQGQGRAVLWPDDDKTSIEQRSNYNYSDDEVERYIESRMVKRASSSTSTSALAAAATTSQNRGFGANPFKDGGPVASWSS